MAGLYTALVFLGPIDVIGCESDVYSPCVPPSTIITILDGCLVLLLFVIAVPNRHITTMEATGCSRRENGGSQLGHTGAVGLGASSLGAQAHADILNRSSFRPTDGGSRSDSSFAQGAAIAWGGASDEVRLGPPEQCTVDVNASHLWKWCGAGRVPREELLLRFLSLGGSVME